MHVERLLQRGEHVLGGRFREIVEAGVGLARARPEPVDAEPAGELRDPRPYRLVLAQRVEPLEDAGEDLLEDVLGVLLREAEALDGNRVDVAREPLDECAPRFVVAAAAAGDEDGIAELAGQL